MSKTFQNAIEQTIKNAFATYSITGDKYIRENLERMTAKLGEAYELEQLQNFREANPHDSPNHKNQYRRTYNPATAKEPTK